MSGFHAAFASEWRKARRSRVPLVTLLVFAAPAAVAALFMFIIANPDRARDFGLLNQKAQLSGVAADWSGMLTFTAQVVAVGSLLLFSFVATWVFGREFSDGTFRYLLALPVPRGHIVLAKFALVGLWCMSLVVWLMAVTMLVGWAMRLPGWDGPAGFQAVTGMLGGAALTLLAITPIALVACVTRGYLAPLGTAVGLVVAAQIAAVLGWAELVPWCLPAVATGLAPGAAVGPVGLGVTAVTALLGVVGTVVWWYSRDAGK